MGGGHISLTRFLISLGAILIPSFAYTKGTERMYYIPRTRWGSIRGERELGCAVKNKEDFVSFTLQEKPYLIEIAYWEKREAFYPSAETPHYRISPYGYELKETQILTELEAKWKEFFVTPIDISIRRKGGFRNLLDLTLDIYATPYNDGRGHYRSKHVLDKNSGKVQIKEELQCKAEISTINSTAFKLFESKVYNEAQPAFQEASNHPSEKSWEDPRPRPLPGGGESYRSPSSIKGNHK